MEALADRIGGRALSEGEVAVEEAASHQADLQDPGSAFPLKPVTTALFRSTATPPQKPSSQIYTMLSYLLTVENGCASQYRESRTSLPSIKDAFYVLACLPT